MNKITYLQEVSKQKLKYLKKIPLNRRENYKNIYVHAFSHQEHNELETFFPNRVNYKTNNNFGHDYIFNSLYEFDLIIINDYDSIINYEFIQSCMDILQKKGELWIFVHKSNDILNGDTNTKLLETMFHENELRFYKNTLFDEEYPLDILIINKKQNQLKNTNNTL